MDFRQLIEGYNSPALSIGGINWYPSRMPKEPFPYIEFARIEDPAQLRRVVGPEQFEGLRSAEVYLGITLQHFGNTKGGRKIGNEIEKLIQDLAGDSIAFSTDSHFLIRIRPVTDGYLRIAKYFDYDGRSKKSMYYVPEIVVILRGVPKVDSNYTMQWKLTTEPTGPRLKLRNTWGGVSLNPDDYAEDDLVEVGSKLYILSDAAERAVEDLLSNKNKNTDDLLEIENDYWLDNNYKLTRRYDQKNTVFFNSTGTQAGFYSDGGNLHYFIGTRVWKIDSDSKLNKIREFMKEFLVAVKGKTRSKVKKIVYPRNPF